MGILAKHGLESRNQNCTFAFIENLIDKGEISLTKDELKEIFDRDVRQDLEFSTKILDIREKMQYSIKTHLEEKEFEILKERTKFLLDKLRREIERE